MRRHQPNKRPSWKEIKRIEDALSSIQWGILSKGPEKVRNKWNYL